MAESREFVLAQLNRLPARWGVEVRGKYSWLRCPYHKDGNESTPSLAVNLERKVTSKGSFEVGSARCHGCGTFVPRWGVLAQKLELVAESFGSDDSAGVIFTSDTDAAMLGEGTNIHLPNMANMLPWNPEEDWRTINGKLMVRVGAKLMFNEQIERMQAYLPCYVNEAHVGGVRANLKKRGKRNYFNTDGEWVRDVGLYPYDYVSRMLRRNKWKTLVLVEGARDALKAIQSGIPALGILGTGNWSESKAELALALNVKRIITAFDPDEAGDKATKNVHRMLKGEIWIRKFTFPEPDMDPGNMTDAVANRLLTHII